MGIRLLIVQFSARFSQGSTSIKADGFYDGDGIYRVRFMPEQQGEWHYVTESSNPELAGRTGEFTVTKRFFGQSRPGTPMSLHLPFCLCRWHALRESWEQPATAGSHKAKRCRRKRSRPSLRHPFNKIRMCVFPKWYDWNTMNEPVFYPYEGTPPNHWDYTQFNSRSFSSISSSAIS